nr:MAG TPA: hypothetical protein [Caudoviricetes sp.]
MTSSALLNYYRSGAKYCRAGRIRTATTTGPLSFAPDIRKDRIYPEALRFGQGITDIFLLAEQVHFSRGKTGRNRLWSLAQR